MTTVPSSNNGSSRRPRYGRLVVQSLRSWLHLLLCLYATVLVIQYRSWEKVYHQWKDGGALFSSMQMMNNNGNTASLSFSTSSSPRQQRKLDIILSKYNITENNPQSTTTKIEIPNANRTIAFLHIGKTGGSTISMHLRNGCRATYMVPCKRRTDGWTINETVASHRITSYYHFESIPPDKLQHFTTIVVTVRNPLTRFLSAFAYGHPTNSYVVGGGETNKKLLMDSYQKYTCFPSISYLLKAAVGRTEIPWNKATMLRLRQEQLYKSKRYRVPKTLGLYSKQYDVPINCTELALVAFGLNESHVPILDDEDDHHPWRNHMTYDYRQYYRSMPLDKELLVIRHEHLWEDWVDVNRLLSKGISSSRGNANTNSNNCISFSKKDNGNNHKCHSNVNASNTNNNNDWPEIPPFNEHYRNVSQGYVMKQRWDVENPTEQRWLCELLREEIRTYYLILRRAVNLKEEDLLEAALDVERRCGTST